MQETIKKVCEELTEFLLAKNKAYGDSASNPVRIFSKTDPLEQINIRIDDKLSRIARGNEFDGDDTELDLIGYLVLKRAIKRKNDMDLVNNLNAACESVATREGETSKPCPSVAEMNAPWLAREEETNRHHAFVNDLLNKYEAVKKELHELKKEQKNRADILQALLDHEAIVDPAVAIAARLLQGLRAKNFKTTDHVTTACEEETLRRDAPGRSGYQMVEPTGCSHSIGFAIDPAKNNGNTWKCSSCGELVRL